MFQLPLKLKIKIFLLLINTVISPAASSPVTKTEPRLSVVDWTDYNYHEPAGPGTYAFGYDVEDAETNNVQFRSEERHPNGTVTGSYGFVDPEGNVHMVHYIADHLGYRATIENSKGTLKTLETPARSSVPSRYYQQPAGSNFNTRIVTPLGSQSILNNQFSNEISSDLYETSNFDVAVPPIHSEFENYVENRPVWHNNAQSTFSNGDYNFYYVANPNRYSIPIRTQ